MLYQTDLLKSRSSLISVTDNVTKAAKAYMDNFLGKFFKNIQSAIGSLALTTKKRKGFSALGITTNGSATVTVSGGTPFTDAVAGDILTISSVHTDQGNHIIKIKVSPTQVILCDVLTQSKVGVSFTVSGGAYNLTDAVNDLDSRLYRAVILAVTGTPAVPQTVLFSALTDIDRGVAFPSTIANPVVKAICTTDRFCYIVNGSTTGTQFQIAASAAGTEINPKVDIEVTSYPN